jgi:mRNA interferase HicA
MDGSEFRKRIRRLAKRRGFDYRFVRQRGKGSHGTLYLSDKKTTVKSGEIGEAMLRQLGLTKKDLEQ